jgi:predicted nucleic acid-binding protein
MSTLLDTNILTHAAQSGHSMHQAALDAMAELRRQGEILCIVPQNLYEFWVVCTRPTAQNGLGMSPAEAQAELARLKTLFSLVPRRAFRDERHFEEFVALALRYQQSQPPRGLDSGAIPGTLPAEQTGITLSLRP